MTRLTECPLHDEMEVGEAARQEFYFLPYFFTLILPSECLTSTPPQPSLPFTSLLLSIDSVLFSLSCLLILILLLFLLLFLLL